MDERQLTLAPHVYLAEIGRDDVILLDLVQPHKERQYVLIKRGAHLFPILLAGGERASIVSTLAESQNIESATIAQMIDACIQNGWLVERSALFTPQDKQTIHQPFRLPMQVEAFMRLRHIQRRIQRNEFLSLIQSIMALPVHTDHNAETTLKVIRVVAEAAQISQAHMTCLHQSLGICWMLRSRGIAAQVAIRIQDTPLMGHMIVVHKNEVLSWKPGLSSITTLENFLSGSRLLFDSGELDTHYRRKE